MIRRERDAELINSISNHEEVRGLLARYGDHFDWNAFVNHGVILSNGEDGCMAFELKAPRCWECTTIFAPTCRGKRAVETGLAIKARMMPFADIIFGSVPDDMPRAQWFYRKMGGVPVGRVETEDAVYTANEGETLFALRAA